MRADPTGDGWRELATAAVVGTGRRPVPDWPAGLTRRDGGTAEQRLLDAAAVGGALRRAGRLPDRHDPLDAAAPDRFPPPPDRARLVLDLVLTQPPVGRALRPGLLRLWTDEARRRGLRAHHDALVPLLEAATGDVTLREPVRAVLDHRGRWLAGQRTEWAWAVSSGTAGDTADWVRLPTAARVLALGELRRRDPAQARDLLATTWPVDPAPARAELLATFTWGLSAADEDVLDGALDDRSGRVREVARDLLDRLPDSARAQRLAAVLRPLVSAAAGRVVVELPTAPDTAAVRDGLGPGPRGRSQRAWWLGVLTRGSPLDTWTEASGLDAVTVVATLDEPEAVLALREATRARGDLAWVRAHVARRWDPDMVPLLPAVERADVVRARLSRTGTLRELVETAELLPAPWSEPDGRRVLERIAALPAGPVDGHRLAELLATWLRPGHRPDVERLAARDTPQHDALHRVAHYLAFVPTILEAFA